ncbi:MAG: acyl-CoA dehydrogenase family protein, partial [Mycobacteriales bacterium]
MDFDFTPEQEAFRSAVRDALAHLLPRDRLRETIRDGGTLPPEVWSAMVELGWPALLVPEAAGGL